MDLRADIAEPILLKSLDRILIPTGLHIQLPEGYEAQVRPRSGLTLKKGIVAQLGTIDNQFRGDIGLIIINLSKEDYMITPGERLAQLVFSKVTHAVLLETNKLDETERGEGGFGHTGTK